MADSGVPYRIPIPEGYTKAITFYRELVLGNRRSAQLGEESLVFVPKGDLDFLRKVFADLDNIKQILDISPMNMAGMGKPPHTVKLIAEKIIQVPDAFIVFLASSVAIRDMDWPFLFYLMNHVWERGHLPLTMGIVSNLEIELRKNSATGPGLNAFLNCYNLVTPTIFKVNEFEQRAESVSRLPFTTAVSVPDSLGGERHSVSVHPEHVEGAKPDDFKFDVWLRIVRDQKVAKKMPEWQTRLFGFHCAGKYYLIAKKTFG